MYRKIEFVRLRTSRICNGYSFIPTLPNPALMCSVIRTFCFDDKGSISRFLLIRYAYPYHMYFLLLLEKFFYICSLSCLCYVRIVICYNSCVLLYSSMTVHFVSANGHILTLCSCISNTILRYFAF